MSPFEDPPTFVFFAETDHLPQSDRVIAPDFDFARTPNPTVANNLKDMLLSDLDP